MTSIQPRRTLAFTVRGAPWPGRNRLLALAPRRPATDRRPSLPLYDS